MITETTTFDNSQYCSYRLPCGLCRLTNTQCLKQPVEIKPTWATTITGTTGTGGNDVQRRGPKEDI